MHFLYQFGPWDSNLGLENNMEAYFLSEHVLIFDILTIEKNPESFWGYIDNISIAKQKYTRTFNSALSVILIHQMNLKRLLLAMHSLTAEK